MSFDFEQTLDRTGTDAEKYELREALFGREDVLPMWVADMDLPSPPFIIESLQERLQHPVLGYNHRSPELYQSIIDWQAQHNYQINKNQIVFTHNVANGFYMAVQAFTKKGDAVLVQPPVYPPFLNAPQQNDRTLVEAPLKITSDRYEIDFTEFERLIIENSVKLFLFCHPQNPSGRVWQKDELEKLVNTCLKHQVIIISDEIHSDLVYPPLKHIPLASLSAEAAKITVTLSSPGKTFNLGGLQIGYAIIANPELKAKYLKICNANKIDGLNMFAQNAIIAAYSEQGRTWRDELLNHFSSNFDRLEAFFSAEFPQVKVMRPEASYLVWINFGELFDTHQQLKDWLVNAAHLGLNDGQSFAGSTKVGTGFMRMNLAVSKSVLEQALQQLSQAKESLSLKA